MGQINDLAKATAQNAKDKGFYKEGEKLNFGERIALITSELSEALEAHRAGKISLSQDAIDEINTYRFESLNDQVMFQIQYKEYVGFEFADTMLRLLDACEEQGFDIEWYIKIKMEYNRHRPHKHNKAY